MDAKKNIAPGLYVGWVSDESGYEKTRSREIIGQTLDRLKNNRMLITLYHKDYQSGSTVLVDFGEQLVIDRPKDWPDNISRVRVVFKDEGRLWNFFQVAVRSVSSDYVYTDVPVELFLLQRRDNYRVDVPSGSQVTFSHQGKNHVALRLENISAGGMLITLKGQVLRPGDLLTDLYISLPGGEREGLGKPTELKIGKAEVARTLRGDNHIHILFGIKFLLTPVEEDRVQRYVRSRELELLKKGVG